MYTGKRVREEHFYQVTCLRSLIVQLQYTPGKIMHTSDYTSRHLTKCKNPGCQICSYVAKWEMIGDNASAIRTVSVKDVKFGRYFIPFAQRSVWRRGVSAATIQEDW